MSSPYVGEIRPFAGNFAPAGWLMCNGQALAISEYDVLFNLIGTTYGGDGQNTFNLPDLQSRVPVHQGTGAGLPTCTLGESGGAEAVTLTINQMPAHTHQATANNASGSDAPANNTWGASNTAKPYALPSGAATIKGAAIPSAGSSQPHENMIPYQTVTYIISLFGVYPSP